MKNESLKSKNSKWIIWFIVIVCLLDFSYMTINKYYLRPKKWINERYDEIIKQQYKNVSNENAMNYCKCNYEKLHSRYGDVNNFPNERGYTKEDNYDQMNCFIDYLTPDSLKEFYRKNIDLLVIKAEERTKNRLRKEDSISASKGVK